MANPPAGSRRIEEDRKEVHNREAAASGLQQVGEVPAVAEARRGGLRGLLHAPTNTGTG